VHPPNILSKIILTHSSASAQIHRPCRAHHIYYKPTSTRRRTPLSYASTWVHELTTSQGRIQHTSTCAPHTLTPLCPTSIPSSRPTRGTERSYETLLGCCAKAVQDDVGIGPRMSYFSSNSRCLPPRYLRHHSGNSRGRRRGC